MPDSRAIASRVPMTTPPAAAMAVSVTVKTMP